MPQISLFHKYLLAMSFILTGFFVLTSPASAATEVGGRLSQDATWTAANSPYVVKGYPFNGVNLDEGVRLTIEPGVVVKFELGALLGGNPGQVIAVGTPDAPIIFTSIADDAVGGDTNGDGEATSPLSAPWKGLGLGAEDRVEHVKISYADSCIEASSDIILQNITFDLCSAGVYIHNGFGGIIRGSKFVSNNIGIFTLSPISNNFGQIFIENNEFIGGGYGILLDTMNEGEVQIRGNDIAAGRFGIAVKTPSRLKIENNNIAGNPEGGVSNGSNTSEPLDARNNWWGHPSGPFHPTLNPGGEGDSVIGNVLFEPWLGEEVEPAPPPLPTGPSSVMLIPGIMGSRLYQGEDRLWEPLSDGHVQALYLDAEGESIREDIYTKGGRDGVIDEVLSTPLGPNFYKSILNDLEEKKNNGDIADYAVAPYDWRLSLLDIVANGKEESDGAIYYTRPTQDPYIEKALRQLAAESPSGKVSIIAHSNGGLVAKALVNNLGEEADDLIDQIILVGVPQIGTPKAVGALLHGYKMGIPEILPLILSPERARDFARNSPTSYHLLPHPDYYSNAGASITTPLVSFEPGEATQGFIDAYGEEIETIDELYRFILGDDGRVTPSFADIKNPAIGNSAILSQVLVYLDEVGSKWQAPAGITVHQIAGIGEDTLAGITYKTVKECAVKIRLGIIPVCLKYKLRLSYTPNEVIDGDGTVVVPSALAMSDGEVNVKRWWVNLDGYNRVLFGQISKPVFRTGHSNIFEIPELRSFVFDNLLVGATDTLPDHIFSTEPGINKGDRLRFILHSPLSLSATDTDGNEINQTLFGVPGASYKTYGEVQVITIPSEALPIIKLTGIEEGTFTLEVEEYDNDTLISATTFAGILSSSDTTATMSFPDGTIQNASDLKIDYDSDNSPDLELTPEVGNEIASPDPSLSDLLVALKGYTHDLDIKGKLKNNLLRKIENIEKKIARKKEKNQKILDKLEQQISKKQAKGKIDVMTAEEIFVLLDVLEAQSDSIALDSSILTELKEKIDELALKQNAKTNLLKRIERLEKKKWLLTSLSNFSANLIRKGESGKINDADVEIMLELLEQIETNI